MPIQDYAKSLLTEITGPRENELVGINDEIETEETDVTAERAEADRIWLRPCA